MIPFVLTDVTPSWLKVTLSPWPKSHKSWILEWEPAERDFSGRSGRGASSPQARGAHSLPASTSLRSV